MTDNTSNKHDLKIHYLLDHMIFVMNMPEKILT